MIYLQLRRLFEVHINVKYYYREIVQGVGVPDS